MNCDEMTLGGATCGFPLLPGGVCQNDSEHDDGSFESTDDQIERLNELVEKLTEQRDRARMERDMLNESLSSWSSTALTTYQDED